MSAEAFARVFDAQRARNARALLWLRAIGVLLWWGEHAWFGWGGDRPEYIRTLPVLGAHAVLAWGLLLAARRWPACLRHSWWALVLLDMPVVVWSQSLILHDSPSQGVVAGLTVGLLMLVVVLGMLWLGGRQVIGVALAGMLLGCLFMRAVPLDPSTAVGAALLVGLTGAACLLVVHQVRGLAQGVAEEGLRRARLGRYLSPAVRDEVLAQGTARAVGARHEVTVLFADLRGFTAAGDGRAPETIVAALNRFHARMVDVLFAHGGTLDKFLGDGLLAWFGAPLPQPDHAAQAVRCALAMQAALPGLTGADGDPLRLGIGLHTGTVVVGDIGAPARLEYTAIGSPVNLASRIEAETKARGVPVLASGTTRLAAGDVAAWRDLGPVSLRGAAETVHLHAPATMPPPEPGATP